MNMTTRTSDIQLPSISWGAIFAGFFLGIAVYLVLSVLGTAIGASVINPMHAGPFGGFNVGAVIWLAIMTLAATIVGGFIAGRTAHANGELHGLLTWAVTTLMTAYLFAALVGGMLGTAFGFAGRATAMTGQSLAKLTPNVAAAAKESLERYGVTFDFDTLQYQLETLLHQSAAEPDAQVQRRNGDLSRFFSRLKHRSSPELSARDKEALIDLIAKRTDKSRHEAEKIAEKYMRTYNNAVARYDEAKERMARRAREAADMTARGASHVAWWTFGILVLGAFISMMAGRFGFASRSRELIV